MTARHAGAVAGSALLVFGIVGTGVIIALRGFPVKSNTIIGAVVAEDRDPRKQMPIAGVGITATNGGEPVTAQSDNTGFFRIALPAGLNLGSPTFLTFRHDNYRALSATLTTTDKIFVARMLPVTAKLRLEPVTGQTKMSDVKIRYTVKSASTLDVGSVAPAFEAVNTGNIPCKKEAGPCSPDGRWQAGVGGISLDAGEGNQFGIPRVSCIAGPCPFTRIDPASRTDGGRRLRVSALAWSDTATFLVEADVVHTVVSDLVRQSFPVIFGRGFSFTLPGTAAGPSIEAEMDGTDIVFPLGPDLLLTWATCTMNTDADQSRLYSCELKPGYRFE